MRFRDTLGAVSRRAGTGFTASGVLLILLTAGGCSDSGSPAPHSSTPADICTGLVAYWAKEALKDSTWAGLDWEQKGLSNEQLEIHDDVLAEARATDRREGREAAERLVDRETRRRCEAARGATGSSENWRPPDTAGTGTGTGSPRPKRHAPM
ncbi:hypothetical protein ACIRD2_00950 [Streptomyces sp. NPDC093595]|uniref:hypothetical protein n=1 Tax=Streptomyces sp. NPDC093595 TaxID=3366045 RepID=UPI00381D0619